MKTFLIVLAMVGLMNTQASGAWVNITSNLAGHASACGNIFSVFAVPTQNKVIVSVCGNQGLFASTNNGASWQAMGASTGWADPQFLIFDPDDPNTFWECGMHGGLSHKTTDGGVSFTIINTPPGHGAGGDGIGIDMTDPQRKTIVLGAHEAADLDRTEDGGATWTDITGNIGQTNFPVVFNSQVYIVGSRSGGVFRTTNAGSSWTKVSSYTPDWDPLITSKGHIYFSVSGNQSLIRSTDQGLTWTNIAKPGDGAGWYTPVEMPDGSIVAIGRNSLVQYAGTGTTWSTIVNSLPSAQGLDIGNIGYNSVSHAFFLAYWNCGSTVPANAIWRCDYSTSADERANTKNGPDPLTTKSRIVIGKPGIIISDAYSSNVYNLFGRKVPRAEETNGILIMRMK